MNRLIDFSPEHLFDFHPRSDRDDMLHDILHANNLNTVKLHTLVFNGVVVGFLGSNFLRMGIAELWLVLDKKVDNLKKSFHRFCKDTLEQFALGYNLYRLHIAVDKNIDRNYKWARALGFEAEGIMRKYDGIYGS